MTVNLEHAHSLWLFEDTVRRTSMRLFDDTLPAAKQARNRQYREGLLWLITGLANENPFDVFEGIDQIENVFHAPSRPGRVEAIVNDDPYPKKTTSGFNPRNAMGNATGVEALTNIGGGGGTGAPVAAKGSNGKDPLAGEGGTDDKLDGDL